MNLEEILMSNAAFSNMDPEKLQFIMAFSQMEKPKNMNAAMPFLLAQMNQAKKKNISFTKPEVTLLCEILSKDLPPAEKEKVDKMMKLMGNQ